MNSYTDSPTFRELTADDRPLDETYDLLADQRRRAVILVLADGDGEIDLRRLSHAVATLIADGSSEPSPDAVDRLRLSLHHRHLPKLADAELIAYDTERRVIYPTDLSEVSEITGFLRSTV